MDPVGALSRLCRALGDVNRLRIIRVLTEDCQFVSEIVQLTGLPQPLVSHHLRVLREQGLAQFERNGSYVTYCLRDPAVREVIERLTDLAVRLESLGQGGQQED